MKRFVMRVLALSCLPLLGISLQSQAASIPTQDFGQARIELVAEPANNGKHPLAGSQFRVGSWSGAAFVTANGTFEACYVLLPPINGVIINFLVGRDPSKLFIQLFDQNWSLPVGHYLQAELSLDGGPPLVIKGKADNPKSILFGFRPGGTLVRKLSTARELQISTSRASWRFPMDEAKQVLLTLYSCVAAHGPQSRSIPGTSGVVSSSHGGSDPFDAAPQ